MDKGDVALVAGLAGLLLGGGSVFFAASASREANVALADAHKVMSNDNDNLAGMGAKQAAFDESLKALSRRVDRAGSDPDRVWDAVKVLQAKVDALEQGRVANLPKDGDGKADGGGPGTTGRERFEELRAKVFDGTSTDDEQTEFWGMLREQPQFLADLIKQGEKVVADNPRDKEARRRLAHLYTEKLMTVPDGMEKGVWSNKGIVQEKAILEIDPDDLGAHLAIGTHYSFWPEQFNKRPDAIKEFEAARKIQETKTPEPQFANTYLQLRNLYLKDGRTDDAAKVLEEGLRRFPDDEELKKTKEGAK